MSQGSQQDMFRPPSVKALVSDGYGCPLLIGTSGYSYTEWSDSGFYPENTRTGDMLGLYTRFFPVVELNYTWYQMPKSDSISRMLSGIPADFRFAVKLTRILTHERCAEWRSRLQLFRRGIGPLKERLAAVLVQLPPDFQRNGQNRYYLAGLLDGLHDLPVAVEFRHISWAADPVFAELERRGVTLVNVDAPVDKESFPALAVVTNPDFFYVRFHGRNVKGWKSPDMQKKFDYDYSAEELSAWLGGPLRKLAAHSACGIIFFNNHVRAQAPRNARKLQRLLRQAPFGSCPGKLEKGATCTGNVSSSISM